MTALEEFNRSARFLIVDDEPANVRLLELLLESVGFSHHRSLTDPREVLSTFREWQPDLILLDLMMPHLDGFAVLAQIRDELTPDQYLPVVMLTANVQPKVRRQALQAGARDFLTKPFDAEELELRLRNLLEARFLHLGLQREKRALENRVQERTATLEETLVELRDSQRQALHQERLHSFATMAGGVVHDFNNSLMVLQGFSDLLLCREAVRHDDKIRRDLQLMHRAAQDAAHIVNRLRHFYRPAPVDDSFRRLSVPKLLEETVELAQPRWKDETRGHGREVTLHVTAPAELWLPGHESELREALLNLIFNAVDAMPHGGPLYLTAQQVLQHVEISVRDSGTGMSAETRARCLEPFFTTKGERGTGLGLAMVGDIVRRHGGTVEIESTPGEGTTFRLLLPQASAVQAAPERQRPERPRRLHVLFVDDDPKIRELMQAFLEEDGHTVTLAADGREALDHFVPRRFDLVLTDLSMPRLNGLKLAEEVKRLAPGTPVVMLTGFGETLLPRQGARQLLDVLLSKPISQQALLHALYGAVSPSGDRQAAA